MAKRILAPLYNTYGPNHFRFEVPARFIDRSVELEFYRFRLSKFTMKPAKANAGVFAKSKATMLDYVRLAEAFYFLGKSRNYDAAFISRCLLPFENRPDREMRNVIYDFDDSVWLGEAAHCFDRYCQRALVVFAGNNFLADRAARFSSKVKIVPTSVDLSRFRRIETARSTFNIGWIGSSSGFANFRDLEPHLLTFLEKNPDARLHIVS